MAKEMTQVMSELGFDTFAVVGHDRGARVAYRLALDHPERASALVALDVVPIDAAWERADSRLALGFWPWSMLAQEAPLPERLLLGAAEAVLDGALGGWGTPPAVFDDGVRAAYLDQLRDPDHVRAICEEYRAAATIDPSHDAEDRAAGRRIPCPVRVLGAVKGRLAAGTPRTEVRSSSGRVCASGWRGNPSPAATSSRRSIPPPLPRTSAISWVERHPSVEARATRGEIPRGATPGPMRPYVAFDRHEISFVPGGGLRVRLAHRTLSGLPAKFQ
jgi:hypothetical protein